MGIFDVDGAKRRAAEIDDLAAAPDFWNDQMRAQGLLKEQATHRGIAEGWEKQKKALEDAKVLLELAEEANDEATLVEAQTAVADIDQAIEVIEFGRMLSGPNDRMHALISINAGAGRHRRAGLGADARAHVPALVRAPRDARRDARRAGR